MVVGNKDKRGWKKEKEGRGFGGLLSFFFPPFLLVFLMIVWFGCCFLVQFRSFFLRFERFRILGILNWISRDLWELLKTAIGIFDFFKNTKNAFILNLGWMRLFNNLANFFGSDKVCKAQFDPIIYRELSSIQLTDRQTDRYFCKNRFFRLRGLKT